MTDPGAIVCRRLSARIAEVAPDGLGRWDRAWEIVADPADAFLDALRAWEDADTEETRTALMRSADALVRAWRRAANEWKDSDAPASAWEPAHA